MHSFILKLNYICIAWPFTQFQECLLELLGRGEKETNACWLAFLDGLRSKIMLARAVWWLRLPSNPAKEVGRGSPLLYWGLRLGRTKPGMAWIGVVLVYWLVILGLMTTTGSVKISFISWYGHVTSHFMTTAAYNEKSTFNCHYKSRIICIEKQEGAHSCADKKQSGVQCGCSTCLK